VEGEEEESRKGKIRRWMVACKVPEYDVAVFYLEQADYDVELASMKYIDDERWEQEHPLKAASRAEKLGKGMKNPSDTSQNQSIGDWRWARQAARLRRT
jgi:hypothetical protein